MAGQTPKVLIKPIPGWKPKVAAIEQVAPVAVVEENPEKKKYEQLWAGPDYRKVSPGESKSSTFMEVARAPHDSEVTCFGCGSGREALMLGIFGMKVTMMDFTENCLDAEVAQACETQRGRITFRQQDLTKNIPTATAYGYCCDVMEHIPTDDVSKVLNNILGAAEHVFFSISTIDDHFGKTIGESLHLTVKPLSWWVEQLRELGAVIHWTQKDEISCDIYCSAWKQVADVCKVGTINITDEQLNKNIEININNGWMQAEPYDRQDREVILLAGGPSMESELDRIRQLREDGCALVTCNGAYNWAIEKGLVPSAQVVIDGREFNARFVKPQVDTCRYLIASQAHPSVFEGLPKERTFLWHACIDAENGDKILEKYGTCYPIPGGSTVVLRAIPLLRMLGYYRMHVFGFDSCALPNGKHHAYEQKENDGAPLFPLTCGGRTFECTPWMMSQAAEFRDVVQMLGDEVELAVYGDGLIRHMIQTGSDIATSHQKES